MSFLKKLANIADNQPKGYWQRDEDAPTCSSCGVVFTLTVRRHHCRNCGYIFCSSCSSRECPIPQRNLRAPVRVCNTCYAALTGSSPFMSGGRGNSMNAKGGRSSGERQHQLDHSGSVAAASQGSPSPTASAGRTASKLSPQSSAQDAAKSTPLKQQQQQQQQSLLNGVGAATASGGLQKSQQQQQPPPQSQQYQNATTAAAVSVNGHTSSQERAYMDHCYDPSNSTQHGGSSNNGVDGMRSGNSVHPSPHGTEVTECDRLVQRWSTVRQEALFTDILVQRAERVEPDSMVEYSRETEALTLQPEVSEHELGTSLLPLPAPSEGSASVLLEPVKRVFPMTDDAAGSLVALKEKAVTAAAQCIALHISQEGVKHACADLFDEY